MNAVDRAFNTFAGMCAYDAHQIPVFIVGASKNTSNTVTNKYDLIPKCFFPEHFVIGFVGISPFLQRFVRDCYVRHNVFSYAQMAAQILTFLLFKQSVLHSTVISNGKSRNKSVLTCL